MDLKIVCLLLLGLLSIALAQIEGESDGGGSQEERPPEECNCRRRGWGKHKWGGEDGKKKCPPVSLGVLTECDVISQQICTYFQENKEQLENCWQKEEWGEKRECMARNLEIASNSPGVEHSKECWYALIKVFGPNEITDETL